MLSLLSPVVANLQRVEQTIIHELKHKNTIVGFYQALCHRANTSLFFWDDGFPTFLLTNVIQVFFISLLFKIVSYSRGKSVIKTQSATVVQRNTHSTKGCIWARVSNVICLGIVYKTISA